ncbi:hypothetical protein L6267_01850 [Candidatus Parcubacteria bacterium]|nr:hypothetical protein [Candidatus Parcubacteria bacterium]
MNDILKQIQNLNPDNKFIRYIVKRVQKNDYRGLHISQHNRYDLEYIEAVILSINKVAGDKFFKIPPGDYKKNEGQSLVLKYNEYKTIVDKINEKTERGTYNSIKKNFFVDLDRMGFLARFDKDKNLITRESRKGIYYAKLTKNAKEFIESKILLDKYRIFTNAVEKLFGYGLSEIVETLYYSDYKNTTISIYEFVFILLDDTLNRDEKIELLQSYRSLKHKRQQFIELMKKYANPKNFAGDKTQKRDFHNWKNEAQQIFSLLKTTIYFDIAPNRYLKLNVGQTGIFSDDLLKKRSISVKIEYFNFHSINKMKNFELHHIVPFRYVKNKHEFKLIDDCKNLIYLHKNKHKEITKNKDKNIILYADDLKIELKDFDNNSIMANNKNAKYSKKKTKVMNNYNGKLLESIFEFKKQ